MTKPMTWIAAILLVCGLVLTYQGLTATSRRGLIHIGRFRASVDRSDVDMTTTTIGVVVAAGGLVLLVRSMRKFS